MAILIATRDSELEQRCRRAASAEHELELVTSAAALNERIAAREPTAVLLDAELLDKPLERQVGEIVNHAGQARVIVLTPVFIEDEEIALLKAGAKGCCRRGVDPDSLQQVRTVKGHLSNVFQKLGVADRLKLVLFVREGKVSGPPGQGRRP